MSLEFETSIDNVLDVEQGIMLIRLLDKDGYPDGRLHLLDLVSGQYYVLNGVQLFGARISPLLDEIAAVRWGDLHTVTLGVPWQNRPLVSTGVRGMPSSVAWTPTGELIFALDQENTDQLPEVVTAAADRKSHFLLDDAFSVGEVLQDDALIGAGSAFEALMTHLEYRDAEHIAFDQTKALSIMLKLPYPANQSWTVTQGYAGSYTHKIGTTDEFALDFTGTNCDAWRQPILACAAGTVAYVGGTRENTCGSGGYGLQAQVDHGGGYVSLYGHLDEISLASGQVTPQGTQVGLCGNSGWACGTACATHPGTHLHFRLTKNGMAVKPEPMDGYPTFAPNGWYTSTNALAAAWPPTDGSLFKKSGDNAVYYYCKSHVFELVAEHWFFILYSGSLTGTWPVLPEFTTEQIDKLDFGGYVFQAGTVFRGTSVGYGAYPASCIYHCGNDGDSSTGWQSWTARPFEDWEAFCEHFREVHGLTSEEAAALVVWVPDHALAPLIEAIGGLGPQIGTAPMVIVPVASFTASAATGIAPLSVVFSDTSTPGTAPIGTWLWEFGDGSTSTQRNPAHVYSAAGTYTVCLRVTTSVGSDTATTTVTVMPPLVRPVASYTASPTSGSAPLTVSFTDTSTPGSAAITDWRWDFGDGITSTDRNPSHVYWAAGTYAVGLTVTTEAGSHTASGSIIAGAPDVPSNTSPTAVFECDSTSLRLRVCRGSSNWSDLFFGLPGGAIRKIGWRTFRSAGPPWAIDDVVDILPDASFAQLEITGCESPSTRGTLIAQDGTGRVYWGDLSRFEAEQNGAVIPNIDGAWTVSTMISAPAVTFSLQNGLLTVTISRGSASWQELFIDPPGEIAAVGIRHFYNHEPWQGDEMTAMNAEKASVTFPVLNSDNSGERCCLVGVTQTGTVAWGKTWMFQASLNGIPLRESDGAWEFIVP